MIMSMLRKMIVSDADYKLTLEYLANLKQAPRSTSPACNPVLMGRNARSLTTFLQRFDKVYLMTRAAEVEKFDTFGCCFISESMSLFTHIERAKVLRPVILDLPEYLANELVLWVANDDNLPIIDDIFGNWPL